MHRIYKRSLSLCLLGMVLGAWQGRVALFSADRPEPVQVYPYRLEAFPPDDQQALRQGIEVGSEEDLRRLLADFLS